MRQYHGIQETMCPNCVLDLNHLWLIPEWRLTLKIPPLNLTWSNHQLPSKFYRGISHTPPYHLGLSPDFTGELPGVCMPYQVLQPYTHLHAKFSITIFFSCVFMMTTPYTITICCFIISLSMLAFLLFYLHSFPNAMLATFLPYFSYPKPHILNHNS